MSNIFRLEGRLVTSIVQLGGRVPKSQVLYDAKGKKSKLLSVLNELIDEGIIKAQGAGVRNDPVMLTVDFSRLKKLRVKKSQQLLPKDDSAIWTIVI